eukprot:TRINITY_DN8681_c0_g2_i3.p1 TRINITY_DN8681_c0_g2~~TRINITY_DN8681_c0_g2_i3.p1  ORF type:complete len:918 (+),score=362.68 TRINITY_DN8681_c0_g2_i3:89-2842(+)
MVRETLDASKRFELERLKMELKSAKNQIKLLGTNSKEAELRNNLYSPPRMPTSRVAIVEPKIFQMTILFMEENLLLNVFSRLELEDILAVSRVCKLFNRIARTKSLWEGFFDFYCRSYCKEAVEEEEKEGDFDLNREISIPPIDPSLSTPFSSLSLVGQVTKLTFPLGEMDEEEMWSFIMRRNNGISSERVIMKLVKRFKMKPDTMSDREAFLEQRKLIEKIQENVLRILTAWISDSKPFSFFSKDSIILLHIFIKGCLNDEKIALDLLQSISERTKHQFKNRRILRHGVSVLSVPSPSVPSEPEFLRVCASSYADGITNRISKRFRKLKSEELLSHFSAGGKKPDSLCEIESHTAGFSRWVLTVLLEVEPQFFVPMLNKMIDLALSLRNLNNFHFTAVAILALRGPIVSRLKEAFKKLPSNVQKVFGELSDLVSSEGDFKNLRNAMTCAKPPLVPYMGLIVKDLSGITDHEKMVRYVAKLQDTQRVRYNLNTAPIYLKVTLKPDVELQKMSSKLAASIVPSSLPSPIFPELSSPKGSKNPTSPRAQNDENDPPASYASSPPGSPSKSSQMTSQKSPNGKNFFGKIPLKLFKQISFNKSKSKLIPSDNADSSARTYTINFEEADIDFNEPLGKGGSASGIYRAVLQGFTIAVKWFDVRDSTDDSIDAIKKEIKIMSSLPENSHTVKFLGSTSKKGEICIFMSFYMESLNSFIGKKRETQTRFSNFEILELALQVANGLVFLHNLPNPIAHLDIKSENVFVVKSVRQQDNKMLLQFKIGDFGEAEVLSSKDEIIQKCNLGTTEFRAPEVFGKASEKPKGLTTKADVWSFGMLLYELMTLDIPYRNSELKLGDLYDHIEAGNRPTFSEEYLKIVSEDVFLGEIMAVHKECTEMDVNKRPDSSSLLKRLQGIQSKFEAMP